MTGTYITNWEPKRGEEMGAADSSSVLEHKTMQLKPRSYRPFVRDKGLTQTITTGKTGEFSSRHFCVTLTFVFSVFYQSWANHTLGIMSADHSRFVLSYGELCSCTFAVILHLMLKSLCGTCISLSAQRRNPSCLSFSTPAGRDGRNLLFFSFGGGSSSINQDLATNVPLNP